MADSELTAPGGQSTLKRVADIASHSYTILTLMAFVITAIIVIGWKCRDIEETKTKADKTEVAVQQVHIGLAEIRTDVGWIKRYLEKQK